MNTRKSCKRTVKYTGKINEQSTKDITISKYIQVIHTCG